LISDEELRINHDFVMAFEQLRKQHGLREMDQHALEEVCSSTGIPYETLRVCRHIRNALAHGDPVNRDSVVKHFTFLTSGDIAERHAEVAQNAPPVAEPDEVKAYRVHAWQDESLEREMIANGFVSVGGDELGDLTGVTDLGQIRDWLIEAFPQRPGAIGIFVGYWRRFLFDATPGDLIVLPTRTRGVAIGEFVGPYHYVAEVHPRARHRRAVSWNATDLDRDNFEEDLRRVLSGRHTIQDIRVPEAVARLRSLVEAGVDPG
jgi:hypothetical protein